MAFPMAFTFREKVLVAEEPILIEVSGKALLVQEGDKDWWFYGVQPGGMAEGGQTEQSAFHHFHVAFNAILRDMADEAASLPVFSDEVTKFFSQEDEKTGMTWEEARLKVRQGQTVQDTYVEKLPRMPESIPTGVGIFVLDKATWTEPRTIGEHLAQVA